MPTLHENGVTKTRKASRKSRVLLIEDNARLRKLMTDVLLLEGCAVSEASDAATMRQYMSIRSREDFPEEPFDLIITDVQMPGESGLSALEWYRRRGCPIPALVVTAFPDAARQDHIRKLHATLLAKPFSLQEFRVTALAAMHANAVSGSA